MDLSLLKKRKRLGILCAFCCIVLFVSLLDGLLARFRQNPHEFHVLPGSEIPVMGPLPHDIKNLELLKVSIHPDNGVGFAFVGTQSGYWLGGTFWRALVEVPKRVPEGKYIITVSAPFPYDKKPLGVFTIWVHENPRAIQKTSLSLFRRYLGLNPWFIFSATFGIVFLLGGWLFLVSSRMEKILKEEGIGEIYRVLVDKEQNRTYVLFSIGKNSGISEKDSLEVIDTNGKVVASVEVKELFENDGVGLLLEANSKIKPGLFIRKGKGFTNLERLT
ncbi:MAG: hypothetical protein N2260_09255 [Syntrophobacterales bacterium]|nr:hypothetical protein [Syntrophobacterales bacterium]